MKKITVWAPSNIALVKYWGKRNEQLILPITDSFSMTLSGIGTETTISDSVDDVFILGGKQYVKGRDEFDRVFQLVGKIRSEYTINEPIVINSINNFPTAAGLASSASGMAALVFAVNEFFSLGMTFKQMSVYARMGSGSASRSLWGGFVKWNRGSRVDGSDSYGEQLFDENHWPELRMLLNVLSSKKKNISSRDGMRRTVETSQLFQEEWVQKNDAVVEKAIDAVSKKDFNALGSIVEKNALLMHSTMRNSIPSFDYLLNESHVLIKKVQSLREEGLMGYVTMDAGPQVKILCLEKDLEKFKEVLNGFDFIQKTYESSLGKGPMFLEI